MNVVYALCYDKEKAKIFTWAMMGNTVGIIEQLSYNTAK